MSPGTTVISHILATILTLACVSLPQSHETKTLGTSGHKTNLQDLDDQLRDMAAEYGSRYGSVPRVALFDFTYPSTPKEDAELNRNAALLITVVTQNSEELPLKRVYLRNPAGDETELTVFASYYASTESDPGVKKALGPFRAEVLCLLPIARIFTKAALHIDFARNRVGFLLAEFPVTPPDDFLLADKGRYPDPKKPISTEVLRAFLLRELPDFEREKFTIQPPSPDR